MNLSTATLLSKARSFVSRKRVIEIARCYHYRGFRYGGFGNNLYEDYIVGLSLGHAVPGLRSAFSGGILLSRPSTFGDALQIELPPSPPWIFPWSSDRAGLLVEQPANNPDVVCHVCDRGVLASHINREFVWLESAWTNIQQSGYRPRLNGFIRCLELVGRAGSTYLVLDGNHRISAMHAIGESTVEVELASTPIVRSEAARWPQVVNGFFSIEDALRIFDRYSWASNPPLQQMNPATVIYDEAPQW